MFRSMAPKLLFFILSCAALFYIATASSPKIRGDGREYILMSQSLLNHASSNLKETDIKDAVDSFKRKSHDFNDFYLNCEQHKDCGVSLLINKGYYHSNEGNLYSYHFYFYSLVNIPALLISNAISASPTTAFYLTNTIFFIISLYFIVFFLRDKPSYKLLILLLFASKVTLAYLKWPHPEAITVSLLVIALCLIKQKQLYWASLIFAFASLQYQPLGIISAIILIYAFINDIKEHEIKSLNNLLINKKLIIRSIIFAIVSGMIVLAPSMFYLYHFSTPNLIASIGASKSELITFSRFTSMYYDLNQGAILLFPVVLLLSPIFFIASLFSIKNERSKNVILFTIISAVSVIPCLTTTNWNSGAENVMRYAFWVSIPLIFAFADFIFSIKNNKLKTTIILITIVSQIVIFTMQKKEKYFSSGHTVPSYIALAFYNHMPSLYNPEAEIYIERAFNAELPLRDIMSGKKYPGYVKRGYLKKLIAPANMDVSLLNPCHNVTPSIKTTSDGWVYYNYGNNCQVADKSKTGVVMFSPREQ